MMSIMALQKVVELRKEGGGGIIVKFQSQF